MPAPFFSYYNRIVFCMGSFITGSGPWSGSRRMRLPMKKKVLDRRKVRERSGKQSMGEMMDLKQAVQKLSEAIGKTTELFYTQKEADGYRACGLLLEPMSGLLDSLFSVRAVQGKPEFDEKELVQLLTDAVNAMEARDSVLLADILQYDFLDRLEQIAGQLE